MSVFKLEVLDEKVTEAALKKVSGFKGVDSISFDKKDKKLTVIGKIDPVMIVSKLRKICPTEIVYVGPAKVPERKKDDNKKKMKEEPKKDDVAELVKAYKAYNPDLTSYYSVTSIEGDPNACVIC